MSVPAVRPLRDQVLIEVEPDDDRAGKLGLIIKPEAAKDEHAFGFARVIKAGPGDWAEKPATVRKPMVCKPGMRILFVKYLANRTKAAKHVQSTLGGNFAMISDYDALMEVDDDLNTRSLR